MKTNTVILSTLLVVMAAPGAWADLPEAFTGVTSGVDVQACGKLDRRGQESDKDKGYFLKVDCNRDGKVDASEERFVIGFNHDRISRQNQIETNNPKVKDKDKKIIYKSGSHQIGWLTRYYNFATLNQPDGTLKNARMTIEKDGDGNKAFICVDGFATLDPCSESLAIEDPAPMFTGLSQVTAVGFNKSKSGRIIIPMYEMREQDLRKKNHNEYDKN